MINFSKLDISRKKAFDSYHAARDKSNSEESFATTFIWNDYYKMETAVDKGFYFTRYNIDPVLPEYGVPAGEGDFREAMGELFALAHERGQKLILRFVTAKDREKIEALFPGRFEFKPRRDLWDYVYKTEDLIRLSGKKYHSKKNHWNTFLASYDFCYERPNLQTVLSECAPLMYKWVREKKQNINEFELCAMERYFENYEALNQLGAVIRIGGKIVAMSFGEKLSDDMALVQIEKADEEIKGAYAAINKLFCENEWSGCAYINREEDMGIEGLKRAKESYRPILLVEKYAAVEV
ncbi:MAG: phosphatidylglycerol lysyltransferase domain-containing protein [Clostridia bacterium]|nr:phosphatidylglycerol lysyltransferase domain-containing protein [Clostridia bacterium]